MFEYFPDNYNWSLAVSLAIAIGGEMSEIDSACRPLRCLAAEAVDDATQQAWFDSWTATAVRLEELAACDQAAGHLRSAGRKRRRSCVCHLMAERMMTNLAWSPYARTCVHSLKVVAACGAVKSACAHAALLKSGALIRMDRDHFDRASRSAPCRRGRCAARV
jgi:hypothetical protein